MKPATMSRNPDALPSNPDALVCPRCGGSLVVSPSAMFSCAKCSQEYASDSGIPLLFWPNEWTGGTDVTEIVKAFYEDMPFPNYEEIDSGETLREKAERGLFARWMDKQIAHGSMVLEAGCGTGQLSNYLGLRWGRTVIGTDLCINSLKLAQEFKRKNAIGTVSFYQMNLFRPVFKPETFDYVICNGVLHHTSNPFLGFKTLVNQTRIGGYLIIGLYNSYGRLTTDLRRIVFKATGSQLKELDPRLRAQDVSAIRKHTWFMDQYKHPHESKHSIGEVLRWFDSCGVQFVSSIPKCRPFQEISSRERLFSISPHGSRLDHFLVQAGMLLRGGKEGGFFVMIGRRIR